MLDMEKVLKKIQDALDKALDEGKIHAEIRIPVGFDAIALLQEQDCNCCGTVFDVAYKAGKADAVVHCKDCKYRFVDGDNVRFNMCLLNHNKVQPDDWFCADGEKEGR